MGILKNIYYSLEDHKRTVLSDKTIMKYNRKGLLIEQPITSHQIQPNSVDLTLADTYSRLKPNAKIFCTDTIDPRLKVEYEVGEFNDTLLRHDVYDEKDPLPDGVKWYVLRPHEFCLMASREILNIPNGILSFVQGRSSIARLAIQTEQAGLIDAGFRGTITFEVFNQSEYPIVLYSGMRIAQVYFFKAQFANHLYGAPYKGSKYYDQIEATGSRIHMDPELHKQQNG